jgi:hypothetical protein
MNDKPNSSLFESKILHPFFILRIHSLQIQLISSSVFNKLKKRNKEKMKTILSFSRVISVAVLILTIFAFAAPQMVYANSLEFSGGPGGKGGQPLNPGNGSSGIPLTMQEQEGLKSAILEEYGALNLYNSAIAQLGRITPFDEISAAEQKHADVLINQALKYSVAIPTNPGLNTPITFNSLAEACQVGVKAEIADAALYDELKIFTTNFSLLRVYNNLQSASLKSHLPEFQSCD